MSKIERNLLLAISAALAVSLCMNFSCQKRNKTIELGKEEKEYPDEIKNELTSRVEAFLGEKGFEKLKNSFVVVRKQTA